MKRNIFRTMLFLCSFVCLAAVFVFSVSAAEVKSGDFVFDVNGTKATLTEYKGTSASVTIPSKVGNATVTAIGNEAFWEKRTITSVSIPSTVTSIGTSAFYDCRSLTKVILPKKLTSLGASAFFSCSSLKSVVLFENVSFIGEKAFTGCHSKLTVYVVKGSYGEDYVKAQSGITLAYRYVDKIKLSASTLSLEAGSQKALTYTVSPTNVYYKKVAYTSSNTKVATVDANGKITAVAPGTATITATARDASGKKATCKVTVTPQKVKGFSQSSTTATGYTLKWAKSSGATKYRIYRYNSATNKWDTIKYTTTNYYKVTNLKAGSTQYYRVLAYTSIGGTIYRAPLSATFKARPLYPAKVTNITYKPAHNYINLYWDKADNATGYRIYSYNTETKKYSFVKATTKTYLQIKELQPNTTYTYMVRAYMKYSGGYVYASYSDLTPCTTRPDYVSGFAVKENSVYVSKLTLQWNELEGVDGYRLAKYDSAKNTYTVFATVNGGDTTEYTVDNLEAGTTYAFKIQSFSKKSGATSFGYLSKEAINATTNSRPANNKEAFDGFVSAYNSSKNNTFDFSIIETVTVSDFVGENSENYEAIVTSVAENSETVFQFKAGIESISKNPVTSILAPSGTLSTISLDQVKNISFEDDGNGYRLTFEIPAETDGAVNKLVTELIDWEAIAQSNEGFALEGCSYEGTTVSAKIHNGLVDDLIVTVPIKVSFSIGEEKYEFSETITKEYLFIW